MIRITFAGSGVERHATLRQQPEALAAAFAEAGARFVPIWKSRCLPRDGQVAAFRREDLGLVVTGHEAAVFLGRRDGRALFAVEVRGDTPPAGLPAGDFRGLREM